MKSYLGPQTRLARENFPFPPSPVSGDLIIALAEVKKAAALANAQIKTLDPARTAAIVQACDEVIAHQLDDQFVTPLLQGGAGTSINMNMNEVIANRAAEILTEKGTPLAVHPLDHSNLHQSTNDVNPSALRLACLRLTSQVTANLDHLIATIRQRAKEYTSVPKLARTHGQDAIPTTIEEEFASYAAILERDKERIQAGTTYLHELNLGGTAIGNRINVPEGYLPAVYKELTKISGLAVKPAKNLMALTSSSSDFCQLSSTLQILCLDLSKIAADLRFLASGPEGGIGEITLAELQAGSSIMPGKVNPVMPESVNQACYAVAGNHLTICQAAENAHLELAIMFPVLADTLLTSLHITATAVDLFANKCFALLTVNRDRCQELLEQSYAYATLLTPVLGYDKVSKLVKTSLAKGISLKTAVLEAKLLTTEEFNRLVTTR